MYRNGVLIFCRFVESYTAFHVEKLKSAEEKAVALLMAGEMPNAKRGKKQKALTEVRDAPRDSGVDVLTDFFRIIFCYVISRL